MYGPTLVTLFQMAKHIDWMDKIAYGFLHFIDRGLKHKSRTFML